MIMNMAMTRATFAVFKLLRLRHETLRLETKQRSIEAKQMHVRELKVPMYERNRRLLHQIKLVDDGSKPNPKDSIRGRRPNDNDMILKNDEINNKNEHETDRVENNRQKFIRLPMIPKLKIGIPA